MADDSFDTVISGEVRQNLVRELLIERYRYILQQIRSINENVYRFLAIYQTLATAISGAGMALFVSYRQWGVTPSEARVGLLGLMVILTIVGCFVILLIVTGVLAWMDYRREECALLDRLVYPNFRVKPKLANFGRWYETYIVIFVACSTLLLWLLLTLVLEPKVH